MTTYVEQLEEIADRVEDEGIAAEIRNIAWLMSCDDLAAIENMRF